METADKTVDTGDDHVRTKRRDGTTDGGGVENFHFPVI
jgi:hypothetical protein